MYRGGGVPATPAARRKAARLLSLKMPNTASEMLLRWCRESSCEGDGGDEDVDDDEDDGGDEELLSPRDPAPATSFLEDAALVILLCSCTLDGGGAGEAGGSLAQCCAALRWLQSCADAGLVSQEIADELPSAVFDALRRPELSTSLPVAWLRIDLHYLLATRATRGVADGHAALEGEGAAVMSYFGAAAAVAATGASAAAATAEAWANLKPPPPVAVTSAAGRAGARLGGRRLTLEQQAAVNLPVAFGTPQRIRLVAYAGTGKTTTLCELARRHRGKRVLYLAFNKDVQDDAQRNVFRDDPLVTCKTTHALALMYMTRRGQMRNKPKIELSVPPKAVGAAVRTRCPDFAGVLSDADARLISKVVDEYMVTTDLVVTAEHVAKHPSPRVANSPQQRAQTLWFAQAVVDSMVDIHDKDVMYTHNGYLKRWFLLPTPYTDLSEDFDLILNDEAKDLNPGTMAIVNAQNVPVVSVGDPHQHIYGFNGAKNGLCANAADVELRLTRCFRFDPAVAWIANKVIALKEEWRLLSGARACVAGDATRPPSRVYLVVVPASGSSGDARNEIHFMLRLATVNLRENAPPPCVLCRSNANVLNALLW